MQAVDRHPHVQLDLIAQIGRSNLLLAKLRCALRAPCVAPSSVENRDLERSPHAACRKRVRYTAPDIAVVGESAHRWQPLEFCRAEVKARPFLAPLLRP